MLCFSVSIRASLPRTFHLTFGATILLHGRISKIRPGRALALTSRERHHRRALEPLHHLGNEPILLVAVAEHAARAPSERAHLAAREQRDGEAVAARRRLEPERREARAQPRRPLALLAAVAERAVRAAAPREEQRDRRAAPLSPCGQHKLPPFPICGRFTPRPATQAKATNAR